MTFIAGLLDREAAAPVVTGTARYTLLHVRHSAPFVLRSCLIELAVTIITGIHLRVLDMTETGIIDKIDLPGRMTLVAGSCHAESRLAVMAASARFPFLHLSHGGMLTAATGVKSLIMAIVTLIERLMNHVTELDCAGILDLVNLIFGAPVTFAAAAGYIEGNAPVMAGAAGSVLFHICHGVSLARCSSDKYSAVAISAFVDTEMELVTEDRIVLGKGDLFNPFVTLATIPLDGKCRFALMTGTAGFPMLHIIHAIALAFRPRDKNAAVTVAAAIQSHMHFVAELGIGRIIYILYRMTLGAVTFCRECRFAVMTATTGGTFFHLFHGDMCVTRASLEQTIVAIRTAIRFQMKRMTEYQSAKIRDLHRHFLHRVATDTFAQGKRLGLVMASTTRLPLFHFGHGYSRILPCHLI